VAVSPNNVAVVLWVQVGNVGIILGSDLEESHSVTLGWQAIMNSTRRPAGRAHVFKVPHHGSENAHSDDVWDNLLEPSPIAVLTPYARGRKPLPSESDIARMKGKTEQLYATARPGGWRSKSRDPAVERIIGRRLRSLTGDTGHVRVRCSSSTQSISPSVELYSGAIRL
jgi:hypothetical protein